MMINRRSCIVLNQSYFNNIKRSNFLLKILNNLLNNTFLGLSDVIDVLKEQIWGKFYFKRPLHFYHKNCFHLKIFKGVCLTRHLILKKFNKTEEKIRIFEV